VARAEEMKQTVRGGSFSESCKGSAPQEEETRAAICGSKLHEIESARSSDGPASSLTQVISGHSLKRSTAAFGMYTSLLALRFRRAVAEQNTKGARRVPKRHPTRERKREWTSPAHTDPHKLP
jgi:hypothetical protein